MTSLPGLIVRREFPKEYFSRIVSLVVAINQFSFPFGPSMLGELRLLFGGYPTALIFCLAMEAITVFISNTFAITELRRNRRSDARLVPSPRRRLSAASTNDQSHRRHEAAQ